jgi:hypothetical protein
MAPWVAFGGTRDRDRYVGGNEAPGAGPFGSRCSGGVRSGLNDGSEGGEGTESWWRWWTEVPSRPGPWCSGARGPRATVGEVDGVSGANGV